MRPRPRWPVRGMPEEPLMKCGAVPCAPRRTAGELCGMYDFQ